LKDDEGNPKPEPAESSQETERIDDKAKRKKNDDGVVHLQWRDWIALTIASLETVLLPTVAVVVVFTILVLAFKFL